MNILVVKLGSIGDIIHTLPALAALRKRFPDARIDWIVERRSRDILLDNPMLDDLLEVDTLSWRRRLVLPGTWKAIGSSIHRLRRRRYDVVFDFQGLIKSGVCAWLARSSRRIGFELKGLRETLAGTFINEQVGIPEGRRHIIDKNLSLLKAVGIETGEREFPLSVSEEMIARGEAALDSMGLVDFVVINPGAGWVTKKWSPELYGELAHQIQGHWDLKSLVIWGPGEESVARTVVESSDGAAQLAPQTSLRETIPFLTRSKLFVGGDTGPFHLAGALGVPVVGVFGPSDPAQNGPFAPEDEVVWKEVSCSPCYKRRCPGLGTICLTGIEVPEVLEAVKRRLSTAKKQPPAKPVADDAIS